MKLVEMKVNDYLDLLKSDAPAPGGGSVSALAGAQGVGLFMMVADLTLGKEKYADFQEICKNAKEEGARLYKELVEAVDKDTEAFNLIADAFKMPKGTDEEKKARSKAIADGTVVATKVPLYSMELAYEGLKLADTMVGKSNPNAASDLGVAILNLNACVQGAWLNVKINLPGVKDEAFAKEVLQKGESIYAESDKMAKELYAEVLKSL